MSTKIFILNIPVLELVQPVNHLFPVKIRNALFLFLEFPFKNLLFFFQLYHPLHKRFRGKTALNSLGNILKGQFGFMKPATNGRNIRGGFHFICVGLNGNRGNFLNPFRCKKGQSVTHNNILYKVFPQVSLVAVFMEVFLSIALIIGIFVGIAIPVHFGTTMTAVEFPRKKVYVLCLKLSWGFAYGFQAGLYQIESLTVNERRYSVLCPVVMKLVYTNVFLIAENLAERTLAEACTLGSFVPLGIEGTTYIGNAMTFCIHFKCFPDNRSGFFIYDQFLTFCLISQRDLPAYGIMLVG